MPALDVSSGSLPNAYVLPAAVTSSVLAAPSGHVPLITGWTSAVVIGSTVGAANVTGAGAGGGAGGTILTFDTSTVRTPYVAATLFFAVSSASWLGTSPTSFASRPSNSTLGPAAATVARSVRSFTIELV